MSVLYGDLADVLEMDSHLNRPTRAYHSCWRSVPPQVFVVSSKFRLIDPARYDRFSSMDRQDQALQRGLRAVLMC